MPSNQLKSLWAKKSVIKETGEYLWLPLLTHLYDTKYTIRALYTNWLSRSQQELLAINNNEDAGQQVIEFIAFLHDCGKATPAFQTKSGYDHNYDLDNELLDKLANVGFTGLSVDMLTESRKSPHAMAGEAILENLGVNRTIGAIIGGHHGKPLDGISAAKENEEDHTSNYLQTDKHTTEQNNWKSIHQELLDLALSECGYDSVDDLPQLTQPQAIIIEGLLIMADWLASSEYTKYYDKSIHDLVNKQMFTLVNLDTTFDEIDEVDRFKTAWNNWHVSDKWEPMNVDNEPYKTRWGFTPKPIQSMITNRIEATTDPGMIIVEAEMGIGKTEIALLASEQLAYKTGKSGLFFGLPTQATSNMMFGRVVKWLEYLSHNNDEEYLMRLATGNAGFNSEYMAMTDANSVDQENKESGVYTNSWFNGKKSILLDFTTGTIDNLLQMGLKQKHLALKHLGLSRDVVVIDEAHAYDSYMNSFLYEALEWLGTYHVPVIVLSATLPIAKRNDLLNSYYHGKYGRKLTRDGIVPDNFDKEQGYPLLSILDGKQVSQYHDFPGNEDKHIQVELMDDNDEMLIASALENISNGGVAGIIVNTIKHAQSIADQIPDDIPHILLHSSFLSTDRKKIEDEITSGLGKPTGENINDKLRPDKYIVIGTQVLEQSLDIDFDVLYSEIAPIDLLLQRVGRLHRHQRTRPQELENPKFYVFGIQPNHEYGNSKYIYPNYLLRKTEDLLTSELVLPRDIPTLVNEVYSTDNDTAEYAELYKAFSQETKIEQTKAQVFQINNPRNKVGISIHGWLNNQQKVDSEQKALAAVRDISEGIEVILLKKNAENLLTTLDNIQVMGYNEKVIAMQTIRLPSAFCYPDIIENTIDELETITKNNVDWSGSSWLKNAVCLVLDNNNNAKLGDYNLHYSSSNGLTYKKKEDD
jgi:CRISPR-associated endonuclease/helicase Cas3